MRRRAGDDAVVVGRIALRFHQRFLPALRAADEIAVSRFFPVVRGGDRLACYGCGMDRAMAVVGDFFGRAECEAADTRSIVVAGIGRCRCVATAQSFSQRPVRNVAGEAAIADTLELAVPVLLHRGPFERHDRAIVGGAPGF